MVAFFQSLEKTLAAGVGVLILIMILVGLVTGQFVRVGDPIWWAFVMRWLHVLSGVMWIGILWYFNFVQTPTMPTIQPVEHRAAITKFIAPNALFWFRWAALATVVTGLLLAWMNGYILQALTFQKGTVAIGIGMWLALIMAFNVWFVIWPNQKKVLGLVPADDDAKAQAARLAMLTSRANFVLSLPMLYCMVTARLVG
jgi:uncharacterized membrane protein